MAIMLYLFIVVFITAFLVDILPFQKISKNILGLSKKTITTIQLSSIDDSAKQSLLLSYSFAIFKQSLIIAALTLLIVAVVYGCFLLSDFFKQLSFQNLVDYSLTLNGILVSVVSFFLYFLIKKIYVKFRI
jgi:hypothetical protein